MQMSYLAFQPLSPSYTFANHSSPSPRSYDSQKKRHKYFIAPFSTHTYHRYTHNQTQPFFIPISFLPTSITCPSSHSHDPPSSSSHLSRLIQSKPPHYPPSSPPHSFPILSSSASSSSTATNDANYPQQSRDIATTTPTRPDLEDGHHTLPSELPLSRAEKSRLDREIAQIYLPALGALALDPIVSLMDTAMVGRLGSLALGGVAISNTIFNLAFMCLNFLGIATTPLIALAYGQKDADKASMAINNALWVAIIVGTSAALLLGGFAPYVVSVFGANTHVQPYAVQYLRARVISAPFFLSTMVFQSAFRGYQDTKTPFYMHIIADIVNLSLFPLLIFGLKWGCIGAGLATSLAHISLCCGLAILLLRKKIFRPQEMGRSQIKNIYILLKTGIVLSVRTFSIMSSVSLATATAAYMGTKHIAAFEIGRQLWALFARLLDAISVAAQALVPAALGKNDFVRAKQTANRLLQIGFGLGVVLAAVLLLGQDAVPRIFSSDPAVLALVQASFPVMALCQPVNGLVFVLDGVFTAARRYTFLSWAVFAASACCWVALTAIRNIRLPLYWVWHALNLMMIIRAVVLGIRYWKKNPLSPGSQRSIVDLSAKDKDD